jgi:hypothetical protein
VAQITPLPALSLHALTHRPHSRCGVIVPHAPKFRLILDEDRARHSRREAVVSFRGRLLSGRDH